MEQLFWIYIISMGLVVWLGITAGVVKKFELNRTPLTAREKMQLPFVVVVFILNNLLQSGLSGLLNKNQSGTFLRFGTVHLPIGLGILMEVRNECGIILSPFNWVSIYNQVITQTQPVN